MSDSRRGSLSSRRGSSARSRAGSLSIGGVERRGSFYSEDVSKRSTVAVVVDDPDGKKQMEKELEAVFNGGRSQLTLFSVIMLCTFKNQSIKAQFQFKKRNLCCTYSKKSCRTQKAFLNNYVAVTYLLSKISKRQLSIECTIL